MAGGRATAKMAFILFQVFSLDKPIIECILSEQDEKEKNDGL